MLNPEQLQKARARVRLHKAAQCFSKNFPNGLDASESMCFTRWSDYTKLERNYQRLFTRYKRETKLLRSKLPRISDTKKYCPDPKCGSPLVPLSSLNVRICGGCHTTYKWDLAPGQHSLLIKGLTGDTREPKGPNYVTPTNQV